MSSPDEITISEAVDRVRRFLLLCWRSRGGFAKAWLVAVLLAAAYVLGADREYTVTTKLLPYKSNRGALGGLGGLAGLAGINIPIGMTDQVVPSDLFPEVANSFAFRQALASEPVRFSSGQLLSYEAYFDSVHTLSPFGLLKKYVLFAPLTAYGALQRRMSSDDESAISESTTGDSLGLRRYSLETVRRVEELGKRVRTGINKKTGIISITVTMPDGVAAADLARVATERLASEIVRYESKKAAEQARFLGGQQSRAESRYREAQLKLAEFQDRNRSLISAVPMAELQRLQADFTLASEVYRSITAQYEAALVKQQEDTPMLTVFEPSVIPNRPSSPRKLRSLLVLFVLATIVVVSRAIIRFAQEGGSLEAKGAGAGTAG